MHSALINPRDLASFIDLGFVAYRDILGDVISAVPERLEKIGAAIRDGNRTGLCDDAHSLRGMLACFGCAAISARLAQLEVAAVPPPPEQADSIQAELQALWEPSLAAIYEWEKSVPDFIA